MPARSACSAMVLPLRAGRRRRRPAGADEHAAARTRQRLQAGLQQALLGALAGFKQLLRQALDLAPVGAVADSVEHGALVDLGGRQAGQHLHAHQFRNQ
jgi:hypothetical protein